MRYFFFFSLMTIVVLSGCGRRVYHPSPYSVARDAPVVPVGRKGLIVIDAGHGGDDFGTYSVDKPTLHEKDLALSTAKLVKVYLEERGYRVALTRQSDFFVPLKTRAHFANDIQATLFVSVHYNSAPNREAKGIEIFYYGEGDDVKRRTASKNFASTVLSALIAKTKGGNRGVRHGNFAVIRETTMPAILVEAGFMSNQEEMTRLRDPLYEQRIAQAIAQGRQLPGQNVLGAIRTHGLLLRRQPLYPTELRERRGYPF